MKSSFFSPFSGISYNLFLEFQCNNLKIGVFPILNHITVIFVVNTYIEYIYIEWIVYPCGL